MRPHLRKAMRERGLSFEDAVNQAVRAGLARPTARPYVLPLTVRMGHDPELALDKAHALAASLEDDELLRKKIVRE